MTDPKSPRGPSAEFWDARYEASEYTYGTAPNAWLAAQPIEPGRALVPADGEGRNSVWLAEQGMDVTAVDWSAAGLKKLTRLAAERGVEVTAVQADLRTWDWPEAAFDLVVLVYCHLPPDVRAQVHARCAAALRPGGRIVLEAFNPAQLPLTSGGPKNAALLFTPEMLTEDFAGLEIETLEALRIELDEGPFHRGPAEAVRAVFRKR